MTLEQFALIAEIIAALAVVASLVYVARQLNQNNELLRTDARLGLMQNRVNMLKSWAIDKELMELRLKAHNNEQLTPDETWRLESDFASVVATWEWEHEQFLHGRVRYLPIEGYRGVIRRWPYMRSLWPVYRERFSEEFKSFMEQKLLNEDESQS